jgi:hypothetical protein
MLAQVVGFPGFESDVLVNKRKEKIDTKIHDPYLSFLDFIVKRDHPVVFEKGDIEQPFQDGGFAHFAAGQYGSTLGFFFFDIGNPLEKISQFFFSPREQFGFADSFF